MKKVFLIVFVFFLMSNFILAEESFYYLKTKDVLPKEASQYLSRQYWAFPISYAALDTAGEIYMVKKHIAIKAPKNVELAGTVYLGKLSYNPRKSVLKPFKFKISAKLSKSEHKAEFYRIKKEYYENLLNYAVPGAAWFRYQLNEAKSQYEEITGKTLKDNLWRRWGWGWNRSSLEDTYSFFAGTKAMAENLQLDRVLTVNDKESEMVDINTIKGITVNEIDWKPLIKGIKIKSDKLSLNIPHDQLAIFFPSFQAMLDMFDKADQEGTPFLQFLETKSQDAKTSQKYKKQLCLEVSKLSRVLGPHIIDSVAMTASDPYLRTGTDVTILFEAKSSYLLMKNLKGKHKTALNNNPMAKKVEGKIEDINYEGVLTPDRSVSSYIAALDNVIIVTNSLYQLEKIISVTKKNIQSIASLDEYTFFRNRYKKGEEETAFMLLTDAAIRKWCSPKWRIANSRCIRVAALMSDFQARYLKDLVNGTAKYKVLKTSMKVPGMGELKLTPEGVISSNYNSLSFMTPVAELKIDKVTKEEAVAYKRFADGYQKSWREFFDPIAVRFTVKDKQISGDISILPLILGSQYRPVVDLVGASKLLESSADPHEESIFHIALSIDKNFPELKKVSLRAKKEWKLSFSPLDYFSECVSLYIDNDKMWEELSKTKDVDRFVKENLYNFPVIFYVGYKDKDKLKEIIKAALSTEKYEIKKYKNEEYYRFYLRFIHSGDTLYIAATSEGMLVTFNEKFLLKAMDRIIAKKEHPGLNMKYWLGKNLALNIKGPIFTYLSLVGKKEYIWALRKNSYYNVYILNEWKKLFPKKSPTDIHEKWWNAKLFCPAGGTYKWNKEWNTMESSALGHFGDNKEFVDVKNPLEKFNLAKFGITFENNGLRAKILIEEK